MESSQKTPSPTSPRSNLLAIFRQIRTASVDELVAACKAIEGEGRVKIFHWLSNQYEYYHCKCADGFEINFKLNRLEANLSLLPVLEAKKLDRQIKTCQLLIEKDQEMIKIIKERLEKKEIVLPLLDTDIQNAREMCAKLQEVMYQVSVIRPAEK